MSNEKYWEERVIELEKAMHDLNAESYKKVEETFTAAQKEINNKIDYWLRRMASNEGVSLQEARRLLDSKELDELKWDVHEYIKSAEESVGTQKWAKELENASAKAHISRLEGLQIQLQHIIEESFAKEFAEMTALAMAVYEESYMRGLFGVETQLGTHFDVSGIDENRLEKVISKPWVADGKNFSDRIWTNKNQMVDELHKALMRTLITGESSEKAVKDLSKFVDKSVGNAKSRAAALFQTEEAYFSSCALREMYEEFGIRHFKVVATLDTKTSAICRKMDSREFSFDDWEIGVTAPPFHVRCRSSYGGSFGDDLVKSTRAARDENGKTIHVPNDMTYDEWYDKYGREIKRKEDEKAKRKRAREKKKKEKEKAEKAEKDLQKDSENDILFKRDISTKGARMERRKSNTAEFAIYKIPLQKRAVNEIAKKYKIDLKDINIKIQRDKKLIDLPIAGSTDYKNIGRIDLFPNAFIDEEQLVRTIVHEKCHVEQLRKYGVDYAQKNLADMEKLAYEYEEKWYNDIKKELRL